VSEPAIEVADVSKRFRVYRDKPTSLKQRVLSSRSRAEDFWALRDIALDVGEGSTFGLIGHNGSGKTTLLKCVAGILRPTSGTIRQRGRLAALLELGAGFHPELTGRENVYLNASFLGLSRKQTDAAFDDIVAFAELETFIDNEVKFYSSGMLVRLGFSVAVAARPDILLVDEVLAVGDLAFQGKCFDRMEQIKSEGTSILVVSHNLNAIRRLCSRVLVLHDGDPRFLGPMDDAISVYHDLLGQTSDRDGQGGDRVRDIEVLSFDLLDSGGKPTAHLQFDDEALFRVEARFHKPLTNPVFGMRIATEQGQIVYSDTTYRTGTRQFSAGETATFGIRLRLPLVTGSYTARAWITQGEMEGARSSTRTLSFFVSGRPLVKGIADLKGAFEIEESLTGGAASDEGIAGRPAV